MTATPERQHPNVTLAVLALSGLAFSLLQSLVAPALPAIQHELNASESGVTWILTAYLLSASVATPLIGRLGDIHGKERVLFWVLVALGAGTLLSALATTLPVLIAGRVIQGVGGGVFPLAFGIIRDEFPRRARRRKHRPDLGDPRDRRRRGLVLTGPSSTTSPTTGSSGFPSSRSSIADRRDALFVPESPIKSPARIDWPGGRDALGRARRGPARRQPGAEWGWGSTARARALRRRRWSFSRLGARLSCAADSRWSTCAMMPQRAVWTTNLIGSCSGSGCSARSSSSRASSRLPAAAGFGFGASVTERRRLPVPWP